jgi:hypothetical protein
MTPKEGALPHSPYKTVKDAQVFVWRPSRWANWMFEVGAGPGRTALSGAGAPSVLANLA